MYRVGQTPAHRGEGMDGTQTATLLAVTTLFSALAVRTAQRDIHSAVGVPVGPSSRRGPAHLATGGRSSGVRGTGRMRGHT